MGFNLVIVDENDREYVNFGKEFEVCLNHRDSVAMLKFILDKQERGHILRIRQFGTLDCDKKYMRKNISEDYRRYANEELNIFKSSVSNIQKEVKV
jgi:hypothetical protein